MVAFILGIVILLLAAFLIVYNWNNANLTIIGNHVYRNKTLLTDTFLIKNSNYTIQYNFKEGSLCGIVTKTQDGAASYCFAPEWNTRCFTKDNYEIQEGVFQRLYMIPTSKSDLLKLIAKKYTNLKSLS